MRRVLDFVRVDDIPYMARPNYLAELRHVTLWGVFANLVDGSFSSIVVAKTFQSPALVPIVWATPMLAHLLTFLWGPVVRGRPKVPTFVILAVCALASAGSIALTPSTPAGGWLFAAQVAAARIFLSGLVTVRTSIWQANYPQSHRARIAGRLQALNALLMLGMGAGVSLLFDRHAEYYRLVYPAIAVVGVVSLVPLRGIHVRGEVRDLALRRAAAPGEASGRGIVAGLREACGILRRDKAFAQYCSAQYLLGSSNFMVDPVLTLFLTQTLMLGYFASHLLLEQLPTVLSLLTIAPWAQYYDRVGVLRFRVAQTAVWLGSVVLVAIALLIHFAPLPATARPALAAAALGLLVLGRIANGIGRGGGTIAWNLGHLDFAGPRDAELYMGIHVGLTGLRGLIMPFVGTFLYGRLGPAALLLSVVLCAAALRSYRKLAAAGPPGAGRDAITAASSPSPEAE